MSTKDGNMHFQYVFDAVLNIFDNLSGIKYQWLIFLWKFYFKL